MGLGEERRNLKDWKQRNNEGNGEEGKGQKGVSESVVAWWPWNTAPCLPGPVSHLPPVAQRAGLEGEIHLVRPIRTGVLLAESCTIYAPR